MTELQQSISHKDDEDHKEIFTVIPNKPIGNFQAVILCGLRRLCGKTAHKRGLKQDFHLKNVMLHSTGF